MLVCVVVKPQNQLVSFVFGQYIDSRKGQTLHRRLSEASVVSIFGDLPELCCCTELRRGAADDLEQRFL